MTLAPSTDLPTHRVENQPPDREGVNLYGTDVALRDAVKREAGDWLDSRCHALGERAGSAEVLGWGEQANRHPPELTAFDRRGRRLDEVRFHPSYHALMALATAHRIHDVAWTEARPGRHCAHAALLAVMTQAEAGTMCPINMTYAAVPALRLAAPPVAAEWLGRLVGGRYDAPLRPVAAKAGITLGMAMTEKQGGSDVRANTTRAEPDGAGGARLTGHKWFCSAPMNDGFLTLAQAPGGLSCFLVPRVTPDGRRNAIRLIRLKDKLGNRSNASAEIEYERAFAWPVGEEGRGVASIIGMVAGTRLGTIASTLGLMRAALAEAMWHAEHRVAFGRCLIEQPAMAGVLADLAIDYEAAVMLVLRVARTFDGDTAEERALARIGVALAKFHLARRCPAFVFACMECLGGGGYVEDGPMARLFRESPLNSIWEGSGNVIALDVLRSLRREPETAAALRCEIDSALPLDRSFAASARVALDRLDRPCGEAEAGALAETLALHLQAALLLRHGAAPVAAAFLIARLLGTRGLSYGTSAGLDPIAVLARQRPA